MKTIDIEMSKESQQMIEKVGTELGAKYFEKDSFETVMRPSYKDRKANAEMPADAAGDPLEFKNDLQDILYRENHVYTLTPEAGYDRVILYIHGGAYVHDITSSHAEMCDSIASRMQAKVYIPLYTLAPQGTYKEAYQLLMDIYADILWEEKKVLLMGDSAGGGLAFGFAEELAEQQMQMPDDMILLSPWMDVEMQNRRVADFEAVDVSLAPYGLIESGKMWAGKLKTDDRKISPIHYDHFEKLPRTMLLVGTAEIFYPDVTETADLLDKAGIEVTLVRGRGLFHVFPVYGNLPESRQSIELMTEFLA